jgi:hypothetical protein
MDNFVVSEEELETCEHVFEVERQNGEWVTVLHRRGFLSPMKLALHPAVVLAGLAFMGSALAQTPDQKASQAYINSVMERVKSETARATMAEANVAALNEQIKGLQDEIKRLSVPAPAPARTDTEPSAPAKDYTRQPDPYTKKP